MKTSRSKASSHCAATLMKSSGRETVPNFVLLGHHDSSHCLYSSCGHLSCMDCSHRRGGRSTMVVASTHRASPFDAVVSLVDLPRRRSRCRRRCQRRGAVVFGGRSQRPPVFEAVGLAAAVMASPAELRDGATTGTDTQEVELEGPPRLSPPPPPPPPPCPPCPPPPPAVSRPQQIRIAPEPAAWSCFTAERWLLVR